MAISYSVVILFLFVIGVLSRAAAGEHYPEGDFSCGHHNDVMTFCGKFSQYEPITYDFFKVNNNATSADDILLSPENRLHSLQIKFKFTPPCSDPTKLRLNQFPSPVIGGYVREWWPNDTTLRIEKSDPNYAIYTIENATFANSGNYTAYCSSSLPLSQYRDGKQYQIFIKVKPQILYADSVSANLPNLDQHLDVRQTLAHFLKGENDPRELANQFTNLASLTELLAINLNLNTLPTMLSEQVRIRYETDETVKVLRFHVGNGFWDNNERADFWANETVLAKLTQTRTEKCNCDPVAPRQTSFSVRNFPNGTIYRYELELNKISEKNPNNCSIDLGTSVFMKSDPHNTEHNVTFRLNFEYSPQNVSMHLTNFDNGTCFIECRVASSCPNRYKLANIDVYGAHDHHNEPTYQSFSIKPGHSGHHFGHSLCVDFNKHSKNSKVSVKCVLTNEAGLTTVKQWSPHDPSTTIAIYGQFVAKNRAGLEWWVILLIVLVVVFFIIIAAGSIYFICYGANTSRNNNYYHQNKNNYNNNNTPSSSFRSNRREVFATIGSSGVGGRQSPSVYHDNRPIISGTDSSNKQYQQQVITPRTASPEASFAFYDNEAYARMPTTTASPSRSINNNQRRGEAFV